MTDNARCVTSVTLDSLTLAFQRLHHRILFGYSVPAHYYYSSFELVRPQNNDYNRCVVKSWNRILRLSIFDTYTKYKIQNTCLNVFEIQNTKYIEKMW